MWCASLFSHNHCISLRGNGFRRWLLRLLTTTPDGWTAGCVTIIGATIKQERLWDLRPCHQVASSISCSIMANGLSWLVFYLLLPQQEHADSSGYFVLLVLLSIIILILWTTSRWGCLEQANGRDNGTRMRKEEPLFTFATTINLEWDLSATRWNFKYLCSVLVRFR